jgi:hypothetical protein
MLYSYHTWNILDFWEAMDYPINHLSNNPRKLKSSSTASFFGPLEHQMAILSMAHLRCSLEAQEGGCGPGFQMPVVNSCLF